MLKYAYVQVDSKDRYSFFTILTDLEEGDTVLVDTINGIKTATFINYRELSTSINAWIICRLNKDVLIKDLRQACETVDVTYPNPHKHFEEVFDSVLKNMEEYLK